jgi:hypothetical protein
MSAKLIIGDISDIQKKGHTHESYVTPQRPANQVEADIRQRYRIPDEAICERSLEVLHYVVFRFTWYEVTL